MIRVAHLTPAYFGEESYVGGGERYVDYIVRALSRTGQVRQCVFALGPKDQLFERENIPVRILKNESILSGQPNSFSSSIWQELRGFDLVHIHQSLTVFGVYAAAITRSLGISSIGTDLGGGNDDLMLRGRGLELLDGVVSISQYAASLLGKFFTGPHEVLVGPVDTEKFSPASNFLRQNRRLLCVSRILPHKGIDRIISALPEGLSLTIVGRVYHDEYYNLLLKLAQNKDVRFVIDANDEILVDLYRTSGLFIQASTTRDIYGNLVSKSELMGLTTLEAMSCGLPVVVSSAGSLPELVPDARFGRVFESEDELRSILLDYSNGHWPGSDVEALARLHVVSTHGMDVIGRRLLDFYNKILQLKIEVDA